MPVISELFWLVESGVFRAKSSARSAAPSVPSFAKPVPPTRPDPLAAFAQAVRRHQETGEKIVFSHARQRDGALSVRALVSFENVRQILNASGASAADWRLAEAGRAPASVLRAWAMILEKAREELPAMRMAA